LARTCRQALFIAGTETFEDAQIASQGEFVKSKIIICSSLVVGVTTLAASELTGMAEILDGDNAVYAQFDSVNRDDNMTKFLSVAARIPANDASADARRKLNRDRLGREARSVIYDRYLGLGFAGSTVSSDNQDRPLVDNCRSGGNDHDGPSAAKGIHHMDCGDPSPAD